MSSSTIKFTAAFIPLTGVIYLALFPAPMGITIRLNSSLLPTMYQ